MRTVSPDSRDDRPVRVPREEPATPGSYGLAPAGFRLPETTRLGPVRLQVGDLDRSLVFYESILGLRRLAREGRGAWLGAGETTLVELREHEGTLPAPGHGRTGLFHFALLLPHRAALGRLVRHLGELAVPKGAGDHLVSEALYLRDPDGLGIEVYADRPRQTWRRVGRQLVMSTEPVDMEGLRQAADSGLWTAMPQGTVVGHVHLHVGDLTAAAAFFGEALGFDRTVWDYPGALFLAAGGYHHHLGTNLWAGENAIAPQANEAQLLEWTLELPDLASLEAATASLERRGYAPEREGGSDRGASVVVRDPWQTPLRLRIAPAGGS